MTRKVGTLLVLIAMLVVVFGGSTVTAQDVTELTIWWAEWDPANYLQQIGNEYEEATGIKVTVVQEPWGTYYNRVGAEWAAQGTAFDMVVGDSQWLGQAVTEGHYMDLTEFLVGEGIAETVTPATLTYYGEYPTGSGNYYAYPTEGDANGWAYRKDLFEIPMKWRRLKRSTAIRWRFPKPGNNCVTLRNFSPVLMKDCTAWVFIPRWTTMPSPWASKTSCSAMARTGKTPITTSSAW